MLLRNLYNLIVASVLHFRFYSKEKKRLKILSMPLG